MPNATMVADLTEIVGSGHVLTEPDLTAGYLRDWTGRFGTTCGTVVRPADTTQVSAVLQWCASNEVPVVPQGGNTGLVGGGVPRRDELVLNLSRMRGPIEVDTDRRQAQAGAGTTIGDLQHEARKAGLRYGVDLASRDSATVGGTIATNAGGLRVLRNGDTRAQLIGVEAVLADGTILSHLSGLTKDNTGYHLPSLLAGSEGTLAVVTAARFRLLPPPPPSAVLLIGLPGAASAVTAAAALSGLISVTAIEFFMPDGLALVIERCSLPRPFDNAHGAYLVAETAADSLDAVAGALDERIPGAWDAVAGEDSGDINRLWAYRERHTEAIATLGSVMKMDVTLPMSAAADFLDEIDEQVQQVSPDAKVWLFGHLGEGSLHINVTGVPPVDQTPVQDLVYRRVAAADGSISAEHGVGVSKRPWLHLNRSAGELDLFRNIKLAFDPTGILNPDVLL